MHAQRSQIMFFFIIICMSRRSSKTKNCQPYTISKKVFSRLEKNSGGFSFCLKKLFQITYTKDLVLKKRFLSDLI